MAHELWIIMIGTFVMALTIWVIFDESFKNSLTSKEVQLISSSHCNSSKSCIFDLLNCMSNLKSYLPRVTEIIKITKKSRNQVRGTISTRKLNLFRLTYSIVIFYLIMSTIIVMPNTFHTMFLLITMKNFWGFKPFWYRKLYFYCAGQVKPNRSI